MDPGPARNMCMQGGFKILGSLEGGGGVTKSYIVRMGSTNLHPISMSYFYHNL